MLLSRASHGRKLLRSALLGALFGALAPANGANWQDLPESLHLQSLGDDMVVNGIPMTTRVFGTAQAIDKVVQQVQDNWERSPDHQPVLRSQLPPWIVLNQTIGTQHRSFQIRETATGTANGYVALTSPALARTPVTLVRLPPEMQAISIIDSVDNGRTSQQIIATSTRSMDASGMALEAALKAAGWERHVMKRDAQRVVFAVNKGEREFDAVLTAEKNGSMVMINIASAPKR